MCSANTEFSQSLPFMALRCSSIHFPRHQRVLPTYMDHTSWSETQHTVHSEGGVRKQAPISGFLLQGEPDGSISTTVFRIPTQRSLPGLYGLTFLGPKACSGQDLHRRARAICSDVTAKDQKTRHIRQALINNGYSRGMLQHHEPPLPCRLRQGQRGGATALPTSQAFFRVNQHKIPSSQTQQE